jgi:hydroxyethylthiazole kinase-like uncharacterized protein yjeF
VQIRQRAYSQQKMTLPADIYSVASVRQIDQHAINDAGISGYALMTRAAQAALQIARANFPDAKRWQVICGAGNNAGDGYVLARLAAGHGIAVSVMTATSPEALTGDAQSAYMDFAAEGGVMAAFEGELDADAELLIDALLGSGIDRPVEGVFADVVQAINGHVAPVLALDIPSGLNGDSGATMGVAVQAAATITFVGLKSGLFLDSGVDAVGQLFYSGLDIPPESVATQNPEMRRIDESIVLKQLKPRRRSAHKGEFGHVLIVGGGPGMPGAVQLCGEAALRCGSGLVSVATHPAHNNLLSATRPELMCHGIESGDDLDALLGKATVVAIGPGLGVTDWSAALFEKVLQSGKPLVIDADGLNLLGKNPSKSSDWILTPHPGEAARLLGSRPQEIQQNRPEALQNLHDRFGGTVVLKGSGTLISAEQGACWLCSAGNPGMASPGMGDVLTGIIASLLGQGHAQEMAAVLGVQIHALAGDSAARSGQRGLLASDLIMELRNRVNP